MSLWGFPEDSIGFEDDPHSTVRMSSRRREFARFDVIRHAGNNICVELDALHVDWSSGNRKRTSVPERIRENKVEVIRMQTRRKGGRIAVPEQDVEGRWSVAQEIVVDPIVPD